MPLRSLRSTAAPGAVHDLLRLAVLLSLTLTLAVVTVLPAPVAHAESGSVRYTRGDAPARLDNVALAVVNGREKVTWTTSVRDLGRHGLFQFDYLAGRERSDYSLILQLRVRRSGTGITTRVVIDRDGELTPYPCDGITVRWDQRRSRVSATMPQRCFLGDPPDAGRFAVTSRDQAKGQPMGDYSARRFLLLARG